MSGHKATGFFNHLVNRFTTLDEFLDSRGTRPSRLGKNHLAGVEYFDGCRVFSVVMDGDSAVNACHHVRWRESILIASRQESVGPIECLLGWGGRAASIPPLFQVGKPNKGGM